MTDLSRRNLGKQVLKWGALLTLFPVMNVPGKARAFFDNWKKNEFLKRDDLSSALKSLYVTYDTIKPYPHKFNETVSKTQLRSLEFCISRGIDKEYVDHYIATLTPLLQRIKKHVQQEGAEKGLFSMFEGTSSSYQLFERINIKVRERSFPCPYKEMLTHCKKYLKTFTIEWNDVCSRWCNPTWTGFADCIGIKVAVEPGVTCTVKLIPPTMERPESKVISPLTQHREP